VAEEKTLRGRGKIFARQRKNLCAAGKSRSEKNDAKTADFPPFVHIAKTYLS
jgi:hypothetical protein